MAPRGYKVYRYRNMYLTEADFGGAETDDLGISILWSMRQPGAMQTAQDKVLAWLKPRSRRRLKRRWKRRLKRRAKRRRKHGHQPCIPDEDKYPISTEPPFIETDREYVYEIDLDRKIFHINGIPFFTLECLPNDDDFLRYVCEDHYHNIACAPGCPLEHVYKRPAPPVIKNSVFATYHSSVCTGTYIALNDLLAISDVLSRGEHARVSLLETFIGQCMGMEYCVNERRTIVSIIYQFGLVSHNEQLTDQEWLTACSMANFAFIPQMFDDPSRFIYLKLRRKEFTWIREDTVVYIATYLDDERCLLASISRLIHEILEQKDNPGDYFGVAFSIFHCAIVKVFKDMHATTFSHTGALQFLPSFFADSPSTPGITALARLGYRVDPTLFVRVIEIYSSDMKTLDDWHCYPTVLLMEDEGTPTMNGVLPPELWQEVALYLRLRDLLSLGMVSQLCRDVASMILRRPHIRGHRLVVVSKEDQMDLRDTDCFLDASYFLVARGSISAILAVGLGHSQDIISIPLGFGYLIRSLRNPYFVLDEHGSDSDSGKARLVEALTV
ncbi:hypothetical protein K503DRAFT_724237 [Rhizopogon vinicolor AM-OR11-026]|uniref:F-box domain-containing protein n=1 Tax=Rhizopogon vinicolor AM-OR11-026 TaxID=1314800 RepID=A0A1B7MPT8_9AGAM|nr:hypothetical protein K503DRAFT_724237 [Rhizopogon vinicolor AM-OR11-026]